MSDIYAFADYGPVVAQGRKFVIVNATGCGFNPHSRNEIIKIYKKKILYIILLRPVVAQRFVN